ncbi:MAG: hypothetical protein AAF849_21380 [Bacteroidota bacterium]
MKSVFIFLFAFCTLSLSACKHAVDAKDYEATFVSLSASDDLAEMEETIQNAFNQSFMQQSIEPLEVVLKHLDNMENNEWVAYWKAFALYRKGIFYTVSSEVEKSEANIEAALVTLDGAPKKTSEHYALQGMIRSFSTQFASGMKAGIISQKASSDFKKALKLDENNMRAHYGIGSQDFYTPEKYGGGKKAEEYLLKAISLEDQYHKNPVMPTWGKDEAYEILLRHYIKQEEFDKAKKLFQEAMKAFPGHYQLTQVGAQLVGK